MYRNIPFQTTTLLRPPRQWLSPHAPRKKVFFGDESRAGRIGKLFGFIAESVLTIIPESRSLWTGFLTAQ
jgi:hypothetical protein